MKLNTAERTLVRMCVRMKLKKDRKSAARFAMFDDRSSLARRIRVAESALRKLREEDR